MLLWAAGRRNHAMLCPAVGLKAHPRGIPVQGAVADHGALLAHRRASGGRQGKLRARRCLDNESAAAQLCGCTKPRHRCRRLREGARHALFQHNSDAPASTRRRAPSMSSSGCSSMHAPLGCCTTKPTAGCAMCQLTVYNSVRLSTACSRNVPPCGREHGMRGIAWLAHRLQAPAG